VAAGDIVVFLGPSLSIDEARRVLPARYLGPARCGDILRARRLAPRAIAIVDGVFAHTAAVWHKEILVALDEGIPVFGASSMGALRAAELAPFGMTGIGRIFEAYRDGVYRDDDEVALLHGPAESAYRELSEAMVNIRATMVNAVCMGVVSHDAAERLIGCAKDVFYQERTWDTAVDHAWPGNREARDRDRLRRFIRNGGYVNQKRLDALELLTHLAGDPVPRAIVATPAHRTSVVLKLHHDVMCEPFDTPADDLPLDERVARQARTLGRLYPLLCRLARLMAVADGLGDGRSAADSRVDATGDAGLEIHFDSRMDAGRRTGWDGGFDDEGRERFVRRMRRLRAVVADYVGRHGARSARQTQRRCLLDMLRLDDAYRRLRPDRRTHGRDVRSVRSMGWIRRAETALYQGIAILWALVEERLDRERVESAVPLQALSDEFRRKRGLQQRADTLAWRRVHDLDGRGYERLVTLDARLSMVTTGSQAYATGLPFATDAVCHLVDAIRVSGLYARLERRVSRANTPITRARGHSAVPE
jgi:hypothetical protein